MKKVPCFKCGQDVPTDTDHIWGARVEAPEGSAEPWYIAIFCDECGPNFVDPETGTRPHRINVAAKRKQSLT